MIKINSVIKTQVFNDLYSVKVNGEKADCYYSRQSKMPYNTFWPGYQRPIEQTEICQFLSVYADQSITVSVKPLKKVLTPDSDIAIRPLSKKVNYKIDNGELIFTLKDFGSYSIEIDGYHENLMIFYNEYVDYGKKYAGYNIIRYGKGEHNVGSLYVEDHTAVILEDGAVFYGGIETICANDVVICGNGIIDGSKEQRITAYDSPHKDYTDYEGENADESLIPSDKDGLKKWLDAKKILHACIHLYRSNSVVIDGVILRDSPCYNLSPIACNGVKINNVKLIGSWRYNSDGIDIMNSSDVSITNCFLRNFDDCIVIKGDLGYENLPVENITAENCVTWCDWGRNLEVGAETNAPTMNNIVFKNCDCIHGSCVFLDVQHCSYADVHDITFENINCEYTKYQLPEIYQEDMKKPYTGKQGDGQPLLLGAFVKSWNHYTKHGKHSGMKNITFKNVNVLCDGDIAMPQSVFTGISKECCVNNITVENITQNGKKIDMQKNGNITITDFVYNVLYK